MTIREELVQRVFDGEAFYIDFEKRTMKVGKDYLIKNGEYDTTRELTLKVSTYNALRVIEDLYQFYKYSLPSERSDNKKHKYFKALQIEEIDDAHLLKAERREVARAALESFILCAVLNGSLIWDKVLEEDSKAKWFWQSKNDSNLIILKNWIENK